MGPGLDARAAAAARGLTLTAVVADAEYGRQQHRAPSVASSAAPYALGIRDATVFRGTPTSASIVGNRSPQSARRWPDQEAVACDAQRCSAARALGRVTWRMAPIRVEADFAALASPGHGLAASATCPRIWLAVRRGLGPTGRRRITSCRAGDRVPLAPRAAGASRWAIDRLPGLPRRAWPRPLRSRSYPAGNTMVIARVAYAFIQRERMQPHAGPQLTFPQARAVRKEIFTGLLFISRLDTCSG